MLSLPTVVAAQDPVPRYPENYKVLIENDRVRVLDFRLRKGATAEGHATLNDILTAVTFVQGQPGKDPEVKRELLSLTAPTRAEAGAVAYDLYQSVDQPGRFMRLEVWRDAQALEDHKATPHLRASFERRKNAGWMTEITRWKRVPEEAAEERASLAR